MSEKTLEGLLLLQIIVIASVATAKDGPAEVILSEISSRSEEIEYVDIKKQLIGEEDEIQLLHGNIGEIVQLNGAESAEPNDKASYGTVQELKNHDLPESYKKNEKHKRPSLWKFKYIVDKKKDEPGFDFTPEEMEKFKIWKDGLIPYYIDVVSFSDKVLRDKIRNFLQMVNSVTSIKFVELPGPPSNDNDRWVFFMNRRGLLGCADHSVKNFSNTGVQQVVLGYDCIATRGEIAEAVMSIVGVPAQHNAPDRDKYIKVNMQNIRADKQYLFEKLNDNEWLFHDLAYDFNSVTHYDIHKHSSNGHATIELKKSTEDINPATEFSAIDLLKIKMLYNFLTKTKQIQTPVCEKLFRLSSKFKPGPSTSKRLKPRKKPSRYSGIADPKAEESNEKTEGIELNEPNDENTNNIKNSEKDEEEKKQDDKEIPANDENLENDNEKNEEEKPTNEHENTDADKPSENEKRSKHSPLKGRDSFKSKLKLDVLGRLSDYDSSHDTKKIPLSLKVKKPFIDPLLALSDYETDERGK